MAEEFLIYSINDLVGDQLTEGGLTAVSGSPTPTLAQINDDDSVLNTLLDGDANQVLAADLIIDGVLVGTAGDAISIGSDIDIINFNAGFTAGTLSLISVNGVVVGFTSTVELNPNDALQIGPTSALPDTQDYADLVACFTHNTKILCETGEVLVQELQIGDLVVTRDSGLLPIRWIGSQKTSGQGAMAPVRIKAGRFCRKLFDVIAMSGIGRQDVSANQSRRYST